MARYHSEIEMLQYVTSFTTTVTVVIRNECLSKLEEFLD